MPPRLARLLAVLFALALIVVAFVIRGALSADDEGANGTEPDDPQEREESEFHLICDADLGDAVCEAAADLPGVVSVEVLTLAEVLAAATEPQAGPASQWDLWLTLDPMPGVLDTARHQASLQPLSASQAVALGSSPLALLARALPDSCAPEPTWLCLAEVERPGIAIPSADTSLGTVAIAAGAAAIVGGTDFGIRDYESADEDGVLRRLVNDSPTAAGMSAADQARAMLRPGTASAAVTTEGLATATRGTAQGASLAILPLGPEVRVGVVLVGLGAQARDAIAAAGDAVDGDPMRDALTQDGWAGPATASSGLPEPDVVYALREELGR